MCGRGLVCFTFCVCVMEMYFVWCMFGICVGVCVVSTYDNVSSVVVVCVLYVICVLCAWYICGLFFLWYMCSVFVAYVWCVWCTVLCVW